jgi:hypothetical protein
MRGKKIVSSVGVLTVLPVIFFFMTHGSLKMDTNFAVTFAFGLSMFSMAVIAGAAFMGAYRFLKNVGLFKGHYYY